MIPRTNVSQMKSISFEKLYRLTCVSLATWLLLSLLMWCPAPPRYSAAVLQVNRCLILRQSVVFDSPKNNAITKPKNEI